MEKQKWVRNSSKSQNEGDFLFIYSGCHHSRKVWLAYDEEELYEMSVELEDLAKEQEGLGGLQVYTNTETAKNIYFVAHPREIDLVGEARKEFGSMTVGNHGLNENYYFVILPEEYAHPIT